MDPPRPDYLRFIEVAAPTWVGALGHEVATGARIRFRGANESPLPFAVEAGFHSAVLLGGRWVDGNARLDFAPDGTLTQFTLARPWTFGLLEYPTGTAFLLRNREYAWSVRLESVASLADVDLPAGTSLHLAQDGRPVSFWRDGGSLHVGGTEIRMGYRNVPLTAEGLVDVAACRRMEIAA